MILSWQVSLAQTFNSRLNMLEQAGRSLNLWHVPPKGSECKVWTGECRLIHFYNRDFTSSDVNLPDIITSSRNFIHRIHER